MHESGRVQGLRRRSDRCGTAKEATVAEFPVSDKFASVYMTLEPVGIARDALAWQRMGLCDRRALPLTMQS